MKRLAFFAIINVLIAFCIMGIGRDNREGMNFTVAALVMAFAAVVIASRGKNQGLATTLLIGVAACSTAALVKFVSEVAVFAVGISGYFSYRLLKSLKDDLDMKDFRTLYAILAAEFILIFGLLFFHRDIFSYVPPQP